MKSKTLVGHIACAVNSMARCNSNGNAYADKWESLLAHIEKDILPRGSGFDCGCRIERSPRNPAYVQIAFSFHHMDESGRYDGWTEHTATFKPDFETGFSLHLSGKDHNSAKEYFSDILSELLSRDFRVVAQSDELRLVACE